jgi:type IV pilus assembly protein PilA
MKRTPEKGFSLIELLIVVAIILIVAAIAIPNLVKSKESANEASAVGSLRTINTALQSYNTTYGYTFPASLANLGPASVPSSTSADLLDSVLSSGTKSGYIFSYNPGPVDSAGSITSYTINADPITRGTTGQSSYYTDTSLVIRSNVSVPASVTDPPIG